MRTTKNRVAVRKGDIPAEVWKLLLCNRTERKRRAEMGKGREEVKQGMPAVRKKWRR